MKPVIIMLCSPRKGGTTDNMAAIFGDCLKAAGLEVREIALRDYSIIPCSGCGVCAAPPNACIHDGEDGAAALFSQLLDSSFAVFASPVYFYALPAHFKAFIDRSQKFWLRGEEWRKKEALPATALLAAGRKKGEELFRGPLRCLHWFGRAINLRFQDEQTFRGLDSPADLAAQPKTAAGLAKAAGKWAEYLGSATRG